MNQYSNNPARLFMTNQLDPQLKLIKELIEFPTVSRDSNLELINFISHYLKSYGIESKLIHSDCGNKANLLATIGPNIGGGIVLSGHTDVVPVDGQDWHSDPFRLDQREGRLYGRGTSDMKSFCAIALSLVPEMQGLKQPIHLALSYDEEVGCLGTKSLIKLIKEEIPEPLGVIVGEPTEMRIVTAHKGITHFLTTVTGYEAHSSQQHRGVPAIMYAGRIINWLAERQSKNADLEDKKSGFEPGYTTLHCGLIKGGTAANICARECTFETDIRTMPGESPEDYLEELQDYIKNTLEPEMKSIRQNTSIEISLKANVPGFKASDDDPMVQLVKQITGQNASEVVAYGAESGHFQEAGFSVVMCGPGSIDQAHQPNEFIELSQVEAGKAFLQNIINKLS